MKVVLIGYLPRFLRLKRPSTKDAELVKKTKTPTKKSFFPIDVAGTNSLEPHSQCLLEKVVHDLSGDLNEFKSENFHSNSPNKSELYTLKGSLDAILKELRNMTQKLRDDEEEEEQSLNWKFAAMVIDRLCMYFFAVATFFSTALILFTSPNLYKSSNPDPIF